jgi:transcriptional regulator EpsA
LRLAEFETGDIDLLALNLDASQQVHGDAQFYSWTQGLLQGLLPHVALWCVLCARPAGSEAQVAPTGCHVDVYSTSALDSADLCRPLVEDIALVPRLVDTWKARHHEPLGVALPCPSVLCGTGGQDLGSRMHAAGVSELAIHGGHDWRGEADCLFVFACRPHTLTARELGLLTLIAPSLQQAWLRVLMGVERGAAAARRSGLDALAQLRSARGVVTQREREILRWIYLGKSNSEIGQILSISPLTVKNHVQKMLHKLDVVNRAQAVGKALDAHLIHP